MHTLSITSPQSINAKEQVIEQPIRRHHRSLSHVHTIYWVVLRVLRIRCLLISLRMYQSLYSYVAGFTKE